MANLVSPHFINMAEYPVRFPRSQHDKHARMILGCAAKTDDKMNRVSGLKPTVAGNSFLVDPNRCGLNTIAERNLNLYSDIPNSTSSTI
jgi:hypothetical protein